MPKKKPTTPPTHTHTPNQDPKPEMLEAVLSERKLTNPILFGPTPRFSPLSHPETHQNNPTI